jgi:hypothetical protein
MSGFVGLSPSSNRENGGNMLNGYARNLRKECAALVVGMAVFTERIRH